jgi:putative oxidoreductase
MKALTLLLKTDHSSAALIARLTLGLIMFPHGAQKMLGWFGGYGFSGTMNFFTGTMHIPAVLAFLVIVTEFAGSLALLVGAFSRVAALGIGTIMAVAIAMSHAPYGFFMNWSGNQKGEGIEYHLLVIGLALIVLIHGAGRASVDALLARRATTAPARTSGGSRNINVRARNVAQAAEVPSAASNRSR